MKFLLCNNMKSIIEPLVVEFFQVRRMSRFLSSAWSGNPPPLPHFPITETPVGCITMHTMPQGLRISSKTYLLFNIFNSDLYFKALIIELL